MNVGMILRNIFSRILLIIIILVFLIPILIFMFLPEHVRYSSRFVFTPVKWFYWCILKGSLLPIKYVGLENIPTGPAIFAANHQSSLDIPLLGVLSNGFPHIWLAKKDVMDTVFVRFVVPLIAVIVDVASPRNAMVSLRKILTLANNHHRNLMIFPEGARYEDGKIHPFFGGFVILAKKTGRPVVPVCIIGVNKAYAPDTFLVRWHPITVIVGKPFVYGESDTDESFKNRVYEWFLEQMRQQE